MQRSSILPRLLAGLSIASAAISSALANTITYQIDMSVQTTLGNFNPASDRVLVAGTFSNPNWIPPATTAFALTNDPGNPGIYRNAFESDITVANWQDHKFIIDSGGTATTLNWEAGGNRFFQVAAVDEVLPVVFFNNISNANNIVTTQVTFRVNMGVQIALGNFIPPNGDVVYVAGDPLNNWTAGASVLAPNGTDTNIYEGTFNVTTTVGTTVNYKYIMNTFVGGQQWEVNGVGPNGVQNRQFAFTNVATTLPLVYFNNITNSSSLVATQITFAVNLAERIARGTFDPGAGTVSVAGDAINNWSPITSYLTQSASNPSLWTGTFTITNTVGAPVNFKYVLNGGGTWENNGVGPNGANDRQLTFANVATTLPDVFFNNLGNLGPLTNTAPSGGLVSVSWAGGPLIRLQTNSSLSGVWVDVPGSLGVNAIDVNASGSPLFFRLIGPW